MNFNAPPTNFEFAQAFMNLFDASPLFGQNPNTFGRPQSTIPREPPEFAESPIREYIGAGYTNDQLDIRLDQYDGREVVTITVEEVPLDIVGHKSRDTIPLPVGSQINRVVYNKTTGFVEIYLTLAELSEGEKLTVDIEEGLGDS